MQTDAFKLHESAKLSNTAVRIRSDPTILTSLNIKSWSNITVVSLYSCSKSSLTKQKQQVYKNRFPLNPAHLCIAKLYKQVECMVNLSYYKQYHVCQLVDTQ